MPFGAEALGLVYYSSFGQAFIYALCGIVIVVAILVLAFDHLSRGVISAQIPRLTYYGERSRCWHSACHGWQPVTGYQSLPHRRNAYRVRKGQD